MMRILAGVVVAVLGLLPMVASADEFVVLESSVPGVATGATLAAGKPISVPDNGRVVLMASTGKMVTVKGPFKGVPSAGPGGTASGSNDAFDAVKVLFQANGTRQEAGIVRAAGVAWRQDHATTVDEIEAVDATDGGDACLYDPSRAMVLHNPSNMGVMTIHAMDDNATATITWSKGLAMVPWPLSLKISDGAAFLFEEASQNSAALVTVHLLKSPPSSDIGRVAQFVHAGCRDQAKLLLALAAKDAK